MFSHFISINYNRVFDFFCNFDAMKDFPAPDLPVIKITIKKYIYLVLYGLFIFNF